MAYGTKYRFTFESTNGTTYRILIQKDGYTGGILERCLGKAPVLKRKHSDRVFGTSMEIFAECKIDGEFTEFYTSKATEFRVQLYRGNTLVWSGFMSPELYSEPDVAPPYDVHIIATDGLGELKLHTFQAQGPQTLQALFAYLLSFTGLSANINYISNLSGKDSAGSSVPVASLWSAATIDMDYKAGESCYDVLQYLLTTLCASITYQNAQWLVWRDNDVTASDLSSAALGYMGSGNLWPIGNLVSKIEPAKKAVIIENPFALGTPLANPGMIADTGWVKQDGATYDISRGAYLSSLLGAGIEQSISADASRGFNIELTLESSGLPAPAGIDTASEVSGLYLNVSLYVSGTLYRILDMGDGHGPRWICNADLTPQQQEEFADKWGLTVTAGQNGAPAKNSVSVPPFDRIPTTQGTLTINIDPPTYRYIYDCYLYKPIIKGFRDKIVIDNGARGEGESREIAHGRVTNTIAADYYGYLSGVLTINGRYITSFADRNFTTYADLLSIIARNYARLVALPRLRLTGRIDTPSTLASPPMLLRRGNVYLLLEVFSWDLLNDELEIDALSLPDGVLTVTSETITGMTSESSAGGGGGTTVVWGTEADGYRPLSVAGDESTVALSGHGHSISDVDGLGIALSGKVEKEAGKGLSTNDYTTAEKNKLAALPSAETLNNTLDHLEDDKQDLLTFDNVPTAGSNNPVKSGGIFNRFAEIVNMIAQKATAAWGAVTNYVAKLTINGTEKEVLLKGWNLGFAGNTGLPTYAHQGGTESYKYTKGASGAEQTITEEFNQGQPRKIDHIGTHPELTAPVAIPGFINDLAYFRQRGGGCKLYVNNVERTDERYAYYKDAMFNCGPGSMAFDGTHTYTPEGGSPTTYHLGLTSPNDTARISLDFTTLLDAAVQLDSTYFTTKFAYGSYLYIDFGNDWWGPRECTAIVKYGRFTRNAQGGVASVSEDTANRQTFKYTGPGDEGHLDFLRMMINSGTSYGIIGIDIVFTGFHKDTYEATVYKYKPRVSEIGVVGLSSRGPAEGLMARGADDPVYRSITPANDAAYDLGASDRRWRYIHAKRVYLSDSVYLEVTADGKAHLYGATGLVVNNGDIASAGAPQS